MTMPRMQWIMRFTAVLVFVTPLVYGCGSQSPQHLAAKAIEKRLPALIGPAQSWEVNVAGSDLDLARGHASEVRIHGVSVNIKDNLTLDDVFIDSHNLTFDKSSHKLTHADNTTAAVSISAQNLSTYLYARHPKWSNIQLTYTDKDIQAHLPLDVLGQTANVDIRGQFVPDPNNPSDLDLHVDSASVASVSVPVSVVNYAVARYNPIVSLHGLRYPVQVQSSKVSNGLLTLQGSIQLTQ
jgi:hypothetical protein